MSEHVREITAETFISEVLESELPVVVDFWAPWCGPCRQLAPALEKVATQFAGTASFVKVDVDQAQDIAAAYQVTSVPTIAVFKGGLLDRQMVGARPAAALARDIADALS